VVATAKSDGISVEQLFEQEGGASGKFVMRNWHALLSGHTVRGIRKSKDKPTYWRPLSGHAANVHRVLLLRAPWNDALISELKRIPIGHDDIADAAY
jgi:predicted phage terminase large subunit-like protein